MGLFNKVKSIFGSKGNPAFVDFVDYHSHILPGVDDGVQDMEESLEILDLYEDLGFRKIWFTPHVMEDVPNEPAKLRKRFEELKKEYKGNLELRLAAENMIDELFIERLANDDLLPIGEDGKSLLVETSYYAKPHKMLNILEDIRSKGYRPILAHPERYNYMKLEDYTKIKKMGVKFQLNLLSLTKHYGPHVREKAQWIASQDYYDFIGSDTHRIEHAEEIEDIRNAKELILKISGKARQSGI